MLNGKPIVSVVIPVFNAESTIKECLVALFNQTLDKGYYEIIVVDDGSTDTTLQILKRYSSIRFLSQLHQGPAAARNKGVVEARGEIIVFTDADCKPTPNWLEEMIKPFRTEPDIVGVKGSYKTTQKKLIAKFVQLEYEEKYERMKKDRYIDFIDTYSAAFKREIFLEMGGYDTSFPIACAEDVEFSYRLANKGYKMVFNPNAVVFHIHPDSLSKYLKKKFKFAYWRILAVKKNPNKIVRDSHTLQVTKLQIVLIAIIFSSILIGLIIKSYFLVLFTFLAYFISTIPSVIMVRERCLLLRALLPILFFLRSLFQFFGITCGIIGSIHVKKI